MSGINKCIFVGRLGQDPEVRAVTETHVCNFSIAIGKTWTDKSGEKQEATEWIPVTFWGKQAELCGKYLGKGSQVYIEGEFQTRSYEDKDGNTRYKSEIRGKVVQFLGEKKKEELKNHANDIPF